MWHFGDGMGWWMFLGGVWMLAFWGAVIALIVWAIKKFTERGGSQTTNQKGSPLDIAKERYARGEIAREEFEEVKKNLS